jgi:hypothetical protein
MGWNMQQSNYAINYCDAWMVLKWILFLIELQDATLQDCFNGQFIKYFPATTSDSSGTELNSMTVSCLLFEESLTYLGSTISHKN